MKGYLLLFWNSIRGFRSYEKIFRNPARVTLIYWFLLSLVLSVVFTVTFCVVFVRALPSYAAEVSKNLPPFSFKGGRLETEAATPSFSNTNIFPIVLDPERKIDKPLPGFSNRMFHIGRDKITVWMGENQKPTVTSLKDFPDGRVDKQYIQALGTSLLVVAAPLLLVVLSLCFYLLGLLQALFFSTLVAFLEKALRPTFTFEQLLNISVYALTPAALIVTVYWLWGVRRFPYDLLYFIVYIIFHVMGSGACRRAILPPEQEEGPDA